MKKTFATATMAIALSASAQELMFGDSTPGCNFILPAAFDTLRVFSGDDVPFREEKSDRIDKTNELAMVSVIDAMMERQVKTLSRRYIPVEDDTLLPGYAWDILAPFPSNALDAVDWTDRNVILTLGIEPLVPIASNRNVRARDRSGRIDRWYYDRLREANLTLPSFFGGEVVGSKYRRWLPVCYGSSYYGGLDWFEYAECDHDTAAIECHNQSEVGGVWRSFGEVPFSMNPYDEIRRSPCIDMTEAFEKDFTEYTYPREDSRTLEHITNTVAKFGVPVATNAFPANVYPRFYKSPWGEHAAVLTLMDKTYHDKKMSYIPRKTVTETSCSGLVRSWFNVHAKLREVTGDDEVHEHGTVGSEFQTWKAYVDIDGVGSAGPSLDPEPQTNEWFEASIGGSADFWQYGGESQAACSAIFWHELSVEWLIYSAAIFANNRTPVPDGMYALEIKDMRESYGAYYVSLQGLEGAGEFTYIYTAQGELLPYVCYEGEEGDCEINVTVQPIYQHAETMLRNDLHEGDTTSTTGNVPIRAVAQRFRDVNVRKVAIQHSVKTTKTSNEEYAETFSADGMYCPTIESADSECFKWASRDFETALQWVNSKLPVRLGNPKLSSESFANSIREALETYMSNSRHRVYPGQWMQLAAYVYKFGGEDADIELLDDEMNALYEVDDDGYVITHVRANYVTSEAESSRVADIRKSISFPLAIYWDFDVYPMPHKEN